MGVVDARSSLRGCPRKCSIYWVCKFASNLTQLVTQNSRNLVDTGCNSHTTLNVQEINRERLNLVTPSQLL
jgi:hypothetical protein